VNLLRAMRILMLGPVNTPHLEHLALAMHQRGHEVVVGGYAEPGLPASSLVRRGIPVNLVEGARIPWLRRLLRRYAPDVVHAQWLPWATAARVAGARPLVATAWGSDVYLASPVHRLANRWILRRADCVTSDSRALLDELRRQGASPERSVLFNWGVDTDRFAPAAPEERGTLRERLGLGPGPVILHTRALKPLYNPAVVVEAFERMQERVPEAQLVLKHIGADPADLGPLPCGALVVGHVDYDELIAYYRVADAFVSIPSTDSSPRSVWEAMACGVPCVLSDLPWVGELIEDGRDALVVRPEPSPVADALSRLIIDAGLSARITAAARTLVIGHRNQAREMEHLEAIYRDLTGRGTPATDAEEQIRAAYERRDAAKESAGAPDYRQPEYLAYLQDLEWQQMAALSAAGIRLDGIEVLDVGAGSGQLLHRLIEFGAARGVGVELMPSRVAAARERYPALEMIAGNASDLPFPGGSFDLVTQYTCLSSIRDPGLRSAVAAEMWRVLRPGGVILSYDLEPSLGPIAAAGAALRRRRGPGAAEWTPVEPLSADDIAALFPGEVLVNRSIALNTSLPAVLRARRGLALALSALPPLRSHRLVIVRKPPA
jgi:glycosyltransferase involved in cell wall biosynthesis/SAM-dependent methyltransferase